MERLEKMFHIIRTSMLIELQLATIIELQLQLQLELNLWKKIYLLEKRL